jgi:hypothetical protein
VPSLEHPDQMVGTLLLSELLAGGAAALASELIGRERIKGRIRETRVRHANRLLDGRPPVGRDDFMRLDAEDMPIDESRGA